MPWKEVKDPYLLAEINDRRAAEEAGLDFDKISRSRQYRTTLRENIKNGRHSGFHGTARGEDEGGIGHGIFQGAIGDIAHGAAQGLTRGINRAQKALGMDPNKDLFGRGEGNFSDAAVDYVDADARINERQYQRGRKRQGRSGFDAAKLAGNVMGPNFVPGAGFTRAAAEGAIQSGLQPVLDTRKGDYASQKARDIATGAAVSGVLGKVTQAAGGRLARAGTRPSETRRAAEAARRLDVDVGLGQITGNRALARATDISANTFGGGAIGRQAQRTEQQLGGRLEDIASQIGTGRTRAETGQAVQRAIQGTRGQGGFVNRFTDTSERLYNRVNQYAPTQMDATDTMMAMTRVANQFRNNPNLGRRLANTRLMGMAQDIAQNPNNPGVLRFDEAQALRSEIGRMMGEPSLMNDIPRADLANVYRALTGDMRGALSGTQGGLRAFDRATRHYNAGRARMDTLEQILGNSSSAEQIGDRIMSMTRNNSAGIRQLRRSMPAAEWNNISSGIFRRLGQVSAGTADELGEGFSPSQFLTNYNKIQQNPEGFQAMFGGSQYERLQPYFRDLATLSDRLKDNAKLANHSGSGHAATLMGLLGVGAWNPAMAGKALAGNWTFAQAMSNPTFLRAQLRAMRQLQRASRLGGRAIERVARDQVPKLLGILSGRDATEIPQEEY